MKKNLKQWAALALTLLLVGTAVVPACASPAEGEIMPRLNTNIDANCMSNLPDTGILTVTNTYGVNDSRITQVVVTTYVEKRSLLVIWNRVDIGTTNNEWVDYGSNGDFVKTHTAQMPGSGTYRVTATFEVYSGSTLLDSFDITCKVDY